MRKILWLFVSLIAATPLFAGDIHGKVSCAGTPDCADALVYVAAIPGKTFPPPKEPARMDQKGLMFQPHVLPVLVGTTVDFLNSDTILHNVFTPAACADKFNLGTFGNGQKRSHVFKKECFAPVLCIVHPEMAAFVAVLPTPYFSVTGADGAYDIHDVPDGSYTLKVWHPKLKAGEKAVPVHGPTQADFQLAR